MQSNLIYFSQIFRLSLTVYLYKLAIIMTSHVDCVSIVPFVNLISYDAIPLLSSSLTLLFSPLFTSMLTLLS